MIILNEIKALCRDKMNLSFMVIFPIVLIYLLGNLLTNQDFADSVVGEIRIGYKIEMVDSVRAAYAKGFMENELSYEKMTVIEEIDQEDGKEKVSEEDFDGYIVFTEDNIHLYEGKDVVKNRTMKALITGFSNYEKAVMAMAHVTPESLGDLRIEERSFVEEKEFNANRSMLDYYGVTMIVMMIFTGTLVGASTFQDEIRLKTMNRLIAAPMSRLSIFFQKTIGQIPSAMIEIVVIMLASVLLFDVQYAATLWDNVLLFSLFFLSSFTLMMFGVVVGLFTKVNPMLLIYPPLWVLMFLGGTFSKEINIKGVTEFMPTYQIQQAAFDLTIFGKTEKTIMIMIIEGVMILTFTAVGVIRFSKMREAR